MTIPRQSDLQFKLRVPRDLLNALAASATAKNRSTSAEIIARLEASGKTLRDEFAMAALTGLASACDEAGLWTANATSAAEWAYQHADAMMAARAKP